jgi:DNA-binding MarR family transcriptional regulator
MMAGSQNQDEHEREIRDWQLLSQVAHANRNLIELCFSQMHLHRSQALILYLLYEADGLSQSAIAEQLGLHGATVTAILDRMEEAGLIRRERDSQDRRLLRVYLTEGGREKEERLKQHFEALEAQIFANISPENRFLLRTILKQVRQNMTLSLHSVPPKAE